MSRSPRRISSHPALLNLREKLGPILWQLPPSFQYDRDRLAAFFDLLPRDTAAAAGVAENHDSRLDGRSVVEARHAAPLRHCLEVRHKSFETQEFVSLLREHDIGLVVADTVGKWPFMEDVTSDFVYVRLHGAHRTLRERIRRSRPRRMGAKNSRLVSPQTRRLRPTSTTTSKCAHRTTRCRSRTGSVLAPRRTLRPMLARSKKLHAVIGQP